MLIWHLDKVVVVVVEPCRKLVFVLQYPHKLCVIAIYWFYVWIARNLVVSAVGIYRYVVHFPVVGIYSLVAESQHPDVAGLMNVCEV